MRAILLIGIFLMLLSTNVFAKWGFVPLEELVEDSDLVVVGTLQTVSEYTKDETDFSEGRILVESIIYGNVKTETNQFLKANDKLYLKWQNLSYIACPRIEHKYVLNQKGIWLLKVDSDGSVRADYPGRFVSLEELKEVEKYLPKTTISIENAKFAATKTPEEIAVEREADKIKTLLMEAEVEKLNNSRSNNYSFSAALIMAFISFGLYWVLYKSRFKIR